MKGATVLVDGDASIGDKGVGRDWDNGVGREYCFWGGIMDLLCVVFVCQSVGNFFIRDVWSLFADVGLDEVLYCKPRSGCGLRVQFPLFNFS